MGSKRDKLKRAVRKTVKWGGLVLSVLLLVVWIGSGWRDVSCYTPSGGMAGLTMGELIIIQPPSGTRVSSTNGARFHSGSHPLKFGWWFHWTTSRSGRTPPVLSVAIPLWPLPLLSLLATAAAWRADAKYIRRGRVGLCPACGYDRAGLAAGAVCPECGKQPEAR